MDIVKVNLKNRAYKIIIGRQMLGKAGALVAGLDMGSDAYVVTNSWIKTRYGGRLQSSLKASNLGARFKLIPDTEKSKSLGMAAEIINDLAAYAKNRRVFLIAFGGGVIGDLTGFVASIYKRGVGYLQIPTTLLAQVDSAIGGKTGVDLPGAKNLIGAFYQPKAVLSDVSLLRSLNTRQLISGLAEVVKYGIINDPRLFVYLEKNYPDILKQDLPALEFIVKSCSRIKAKIVGRDEREARGIRTILNFGHTLGHAVEAAGNYRSYNHGEAIALGILTACAISVKLGLIKDNLAQRIEGLIGALGLPTRMKKVSRQDVIRAHYHDKKFIGAKNRLVLICGLGAPRIVENIPLKLIKQALQDLS